MNRLLVGYDGSDQAMEAVRLAAYLARRTGAGVTVLSVGVAATTMPALALARRADAEAQTAAQETAELGAAAMGVEGVAADARGAVGAPADALIDVAESGGYDLLLVGHGGRSDLAQVMLGSVATRVAAEAPCPVLLLQGPAPPAIEHILVGVKRSAPARRAAEAAIALAQACGARLTLVHVIDHALLAAPTRADAALHLQVSEEADGKAALVLTSQLCQKAGVPADTVQATGQAAEVLLTFARERQAQVVAIGRPVRPGLERLVLGSESDTVLRRAEAAVLIAGQRAATSHNSVQTGHRVEPATGALAGTAVGALAGATVGGALGGPVGGVLGGVLGAAGGAATGEAVKPGGHVEDSPDGGRARRRPGRNGGSGESEGAEDHEHAGEKRR